MALSLDELRAKLKQEQENQEKIKNGEGYSNSEPDSFLAFWNIPLGKPLNLRFLPDADPNNAFFWRDHETINLTFSGIKGKHNNEVTVKVPCSEMWDDKSCPITNELRTWYKSGDDNIKKLASKYWKKRKHLLQCMIGPDSVAVEKDNPPENPVRRVLVTSDLLVKIKSIIMNPQCPALPTDYERGRDFTVIKGKNNGGFFTYDESYWSMIERPLNEAERAALNHHGLFDLSTFMPTKPTDEDKNIMFEMFRASLNGEQYDPERWAAYYRPEGVSKPTTSVHTGSVVAPVAQQAPIVTQPLVQAGNSPAVTLGQPTTPASSLIASLQQAAPVAQQAPTVMPSVETTPTVTQPSQPAAPVQQLDANALLARLRGNQG